MSETRAQFRTRMRAVVERAFDTPPVNEEEASDRCYWPSVRDRENAAEAVYAQALRDVLSDLYEETPGQGTEWAKRYIRGFAAERGIDLEDAAKEAE